LYRNETEHSKTTDLINKEWNAPYVKKLKQIFKQISHFMRVSDDNDSTIKVSTIVKMFIQSNLFNEIFTLDTLIE